MWKASAQAELAQAKVESDKTVIRAGVSGRVEQFGLRVGDIVNFVEHTAGILILEEVDPAPDHALTGRRALGLS